MHIDNHSGELHPMHLHGHHAVVLAATASPRRAARGGSTRSTCWTATYDIAFVATNPGIWLDHCHHLKHAAQGMVAHLMYEGVSTPYRIGGTPGNQPE